MSDSLQYILFHLFLLSSSTGWKLLSVFSLWYIYLTESFTRITSYLSYFKSLSWEGRRS